MNYAVLTGAVLLWCTVHSGLAALPTKRFFERTLGVWFGRYYRLGYNLFAVLSFIPVAIMILTFPDRLLYHAPAGLAVVLRLCQVAAAVAGAITLLRTGVLAFSGLRQLLADQTPGRMITEGLYRHVRHPLYTLAVLILWLQPTMTLNSLLIFAVFTLYAVVGASLEERRLLQEFGPAYRIYMQSTPMLLPRLLRRKSS